MELDRESAKYWGGGGRRTCQNTTWFTMWSGLGLNPVLHHGTATCSPCFNRFKKIVNGSSKDRTLKI